MFIEIKIDLKQFNFNKLIFFEKLIIQVKLIQLENIFHKMYFTLKN